MLPSALPPRGGVAIDTIWRAEGGHDHLAVRAELLAHGWRRVESFIALYWGLGDDALPWLTIERPTHLLHDRAAVLQAARLWGDDRSLREYVGQVRWRLNADFSALSAPEPDQYFPHDLVSLLDHEVVVDCGAFVGDTLLSFASRVSSWRAYHAFEPDPESFTALRSAQARLPSALAERVHLHQVATADRNGTARFSASGLASASITADGDVEIECVTIDDVLAGEIPTFVKMDIEGAESSALRGGSRAIRGGRPLMAISAYHKQHDLWSLALQIRDLVPEHSLHLRPHSAEGFDTILYAIPPDRARR